MIYEKCLKCGKFHKPFEPCPLDLRPAYETAYWKGTQYYRGPR